VLVSAGVALLHRTGRRTGARDTLFGLVIGSCIAGYTVVDAHGLDHAAPFAYLEVVVGVPAFAYAAGMARTRGLPALRAEIGPATAAAGLAMFGSYGLVLLALTRAPAASVAAVRECSVLLTVLLAGVALREPLTLSRLVGALAVTVGIVSVARG
jgi:drug/metabolite transporter (DMT)-like permease